MEKEEIILRKNDIKRILNLSDPSIYRREKLGQFPKRISLGGKSVGWLKSEVDAWLAQKATERK
jgi:prophage regulatory protein